MERGLYRSQIRRRLVQPAKAGRGRGHNGQLYEDLAARSAGRVEVGLQDRRDQFDWRARVERDGQDAVAISIRKDMEDLRHGAGCGVDARRNRSERRGGGKKWV